MQRSTDHILTTHTGSLPRPNDLAELLIAKDMLNRVWVLRKVLSQMSDVEAMELLLDRLTKSKSNGTFLKSMSDGG